MSRIKRISVVIVLLFAVFPVSSRQRKTIFDREHTSVSAYARYCHLLDGHGIYDKMLDSYGSVLTGIQVGFDTHTSDSSWFANAYNYPNLSIGFSYDNTGALEYKNNSSLGDFYNLYLALGFDAFRAGIFSFGPVIEVGASYCTDKYHHVINPYNRYIGSNFCADLSGGIEARVRFLPQWEISVVGYLSHHSNGMLRVPNWGTNQASVGAKLKYYMTPQESDRKIQLGQPLFPKGFRWDVYLSAGVHSCVMEQNALDLQGRKDEVAKRRIRAIVGGELSYRYHPLLSTGVGIELDYADNTYRQNDLVILGQEDPKGYSPFYSSIHLSQHLHYQNVSVHATWGVYTFKRVGLKEDMGRCFQRIGARYHLPPFRLAGQMFLGLDMRAHFLDRSYCLELSVGTSF